MKRQQYAYVAQHLRHGGFHADEAAQLMGITPEVFAQLVTEAEATRPKLCHSKCRQLPVCPYCAACLELNIDAFSRAVAAMG